MIKVLDHEKLINTWFTKINNLVKKIKIAVFVEQNIENDITLITVLEDLLKKYNLQKNHLLNQKDITMMNA